MALVRYNTTIPLAVLVPSPARETQCLPLPHSDCRFLLQGLLIFYYLFIFFISSLPFLASLNIATVAMPVKFGAWQSIV